MAPHRSLASSPLLVALLVSVPLLFACSEDAASSAGDGGGGSLTGTGGGAPLGGASNPSGGAVGTGSTLSTGGTAGPGTGGAPSTGGAANTAACDAPSLVWKTGNKTTYTSWPDPGSEECIEYNGCTWAGQFAHCSGVMPETWVEAHDIAAVFPDDGLEGHDLCIRSGDRVMIVTAIDTCGDADCDGCCTANRGSADALIDLESYTNARWGLPDGPLEWADLGPNPNACAP